MILIAGTFNRGIVFYASEFCHHNSKPVATPFVRVRSGRNDLEKQRHPNHPFFRRSFVCSPWLFLVTLPRRRILPTVGATAMPCCWFSMHSLSSTAGLAWASTLMPQPSLPQQRFFWITPPQNAVAPIPCWPLVRQSFSSTIG